MHKLFDINPVRKKYKLNRRSFLKVICILVGMPLLFASIKHKKLFIKNGWLLKAEDF
jgi:hypothetical protein